MTTENVFKVFTADQMSNDAYHATEGWVSEYVSGSSLCDIMQTCPAAWRFQKNKVTAALEFGTQSHTNFESEDLFNKTYRRAPAAEDYKILITSQAALANKLKSLGLTGTSNKQYPELVKMYVDNIDAVKEEDKFHILWLEDMIAQSQAFADGVQLVKAEDYDACIRMRQVLSGIPDHERVMNSPTAQRELSIFGVIAGTKVKVRLDHVDVVHNVMIDGVMHPEVVVITDYKTTTSAKPEDFDRKAAELGYYLKMALQRDLFVKAFDEKRPVIVRLLAQEKKEPFIPLAFRMGYDQLRIGRIQYMEVLKGFNVWLTNDIWPSYNNNASEVEMTTPAYFGKRYEVKAA